jgi:hypothetical protein
MRQIANLHDHQNRVEDGGTILPIKHTHVGSLPSQNHCTGMRNHCVRGSCAATGRAYSAIYVHVLLP